MPDFLHALLWTLTEATQERQQLRNTGYATGEASQVLYPSALELAHA